MKRCLKVILSTTALCFAALAGAANTGDVPIVAAIEVVGGTHEIQTKTWSNLHVRVGELCKPALLNADIHAISRIRGIEEVSIVASNSPSGALLRYVLRDAPIVNRVTVTTQHHLALPSDLVRTRASRFFSHAELHKDIQRTIAYFHEKHYHDVTVAPTVTYELNGREVAVTLAVNEGVPQYVEEIVVQGSGTFSAEALRGLLHCHARSGGGSGGEYNPETFPDDAWRIRDYFARNGFADADVSVAAEPGSRSGAVRVVVDVKEGPVCRIAQIAWKPESFATGHGEAAAAAATVKEGDLWTPAVPDALAADLRKFCAANGTSNATIAVRSIMHESSSPEEPRIKVVVTVSKGKKAVPPATR